MFERRDILLDNNQIDKIKKAKIAIFGLGGVGGYTFEALARMGIENFILCDGDSFTDSNLNRQILSSKDNLGRNKAEVAKERALSINENISIEVYPFFLNEETINMIDLKDTYIVDCIDDVNAKILLIKYSKEHGNKIISMMGAGNRLKAEFVSKDIFKTTNDPLAKKMRYELKKEGISKLKVVYTEDLPIKTDSTTIGSTSYIVGKAGLKVAEEVILDIINN